MTIIEHVEKELMRITQSITLGTGKSARNHMDGFVLADLKKKQEVLKKVLKILKENLD